MANKCPNCGFEYGEFDIYCSRCGAKLAVANKLEEATNNIMQNFYSENNKDEINKKAKFEFSSKFSNKNGSVFEVIAVMFILCLILTFLLTILFNKHTKTRAYLEYKNLITKPALMPVLKTPSTADEFSLNLAQNEHFLKLYLNFSSDEFEKKEQIFNSYIAEINKIQYLSNQDLVLEKYPKCASITGRSEEKTCLKLYNKTFKNTGVKAFSDHNLIYFYPDKKYISKTFAKYFKNDMKSFIKLEAKYPNPVEFDNILQIKPDIICEKIVKYEKLYNKISNQNAKAYLEEAMYDDIRSLIFARDIYATTTQEMKKPYKKAYLYFTRHYKKSAFTPLILSYLDKQKSYDEENFKNDYPYKLYEDTFDDNVENITFKDIFVQLRKNLAKEVENLDFAYIYNLVDGRWRKFTSISEINSSDYIISNPDADNNVTVYTSSFSPVQEMNIYRYSKLFLNAGQIFIYNSDKLSISKINYNGKLFNTKTLNFSDVTSVFPWVDVVNIDSTTGYHIYLDKPNKSGKYILLSRYLQGFNDYELSLLQGDNVERLALNNMFSVNSLNEVLISFHHKNVAPNETSEQSPTYKIHIRTLGQPKQKNDLDSVPFYDNQKTLEDDEELEERHMPTIKPKINNQINNPLILPPSQGLEPPKDDD